MATLARERDRVALGPGFDTPFLLQGLDPDFSGAGRFSFHDDSHNAYAAYGE